MRHHCMNSDGWMTVQSRYTAISRERLSSLSVRTVLLYQASVKLMMFSVVCSRHRADVRAEALQFALLLFCR